MLSRTEERLKELVAFRSTPDNQAEVAALLDAVEKQLAETPLHLQRFEHNGAHSLVVTSQQTKKPKLWLVSHIDVVPASDEMYDMQATDEKLIGRGVTDDKFAAAAFIEAAVQLGNENKNYDFGIMLTGDEESGGFDGVRYLLQDEGYGGDVAFVPDSGLGWQIETQAKGGFTFIIRTKGKSAHGSRPWQGENAIEKVIAVVEKIREALEIPPHEEAAREFNNRTMNLGVIEGGEASNQVPAHAEAQINIRIADPEDIDRVRQVIHEIASENDATAEESVSISPVNTNPDGPWIQKFAAILQSQGITPEYSKSYGGTDARFFAEKNIPVIVSQPNGGSLHADDEWIERKGLEQLVEITKELIRES